MPQHSTHLTLLSKDPYANEAQADRSILFVDIDNTLYSSKCGISEVMNVLIQRYFEKLGLNQDTAKKLHKEYFKQYSLSIRGLVLHHQVDPLDYDKHCDAAIPLEELLQPDPAVRHLLLSIDRRKTRVLALTNAYRNHAVRVLKILGLTDLFEAVVSCNYEAPNFSCKPEKAFYQEALEVVGGTKSTPVYFVDDSALNIRGALEFGWRSLLYLETGPDQGEDLSDVQWVTSLDGLKRHWPELFQS